MKKFLKTIISLNLGLLLCCTSANAISPKETREKLSFDNMCGGIVNTVRYKGNIDPKADRDSFVTHFNSNVRDRLNYNQGEAQKLINSFKEKSFGEFKAEVLKRFSQSTSNKKMNGTCLMFSIVIEDILSQRGIENYLMAVGDDHVVNLYRVNNKWYVADATTASNWFWISQIVKVIPYVYTMVDMPLEYYPNALKRGCLFGLNPSLDNCGINFSLNQDDINEGNYLHLNDFLKIYDIVK